VTKEKESFTTLAPPGLRTEDLRGRRGGALHRRHRAGRPHRLQRARIVSRFQDPSQDPQPGINKTLTSWANVIKLLTTIIYECL
jgi:hypothetical protein